MSFFLQQQVAKQIIEGAKKEIAREEAYVKSLPEEEQFDARMRLYNRRMENLEQMTTFVLLAAFCVMFMSVIFFILMEMFN